MASFKVVVIAEFHCNLFPDVQLQLQQIIRFLYWFNLTVTTKDVYDFILINQE